MNPGEVTEEKPREKPAKPLRTQLQTNRKPGKTPAMFSPYTMPSSKSSHALTEAEQGGHYNGSFKSN